MPLNLDEAFRILQICTYSEQEAYAIIAQFTEVEKLDYFSQAIFSVKEMGGEKLFKLNCQMKHNQWAEIHLEFCFLKPVQSGIQVTVQNPNPQMLKFHTHYHQYINEKLLDFTQEFSVKPLVDILQNLKHRFENYYPYSRVQHIQHNMPIQPNLAATVAQSQNKPNVQQNISDQTTKGLRSSLKFITNAIQSDWQKQEKIKQQLVKDYCDVQVEKAQLKYLLNEIEENSEKIKNETQVMNQFLSENSDVQISEQNILDFLLMAPNEQQICEIQAEISAIKDTYKFVQQKFQKSAIPLEYLYQNLKHLADQEFNSLLLLKKCQAKLSMK